MKPHNNIMDTQEKIIALLQGELRNKAEATQLLRRLADSPEELESLLKQIELSRQLSLLGKGAITTPLPARQAVHNRIRQFESQQGVGVAATSPHDLPTATPTIPFGGKHYFRTSFLIGLTLASMGLAGIIGYVIGSKNGEGKEGATAKTPATDPNYVIQAQPNGAERNNGIPSQQTDHAQEKGTSPQSSSPLQTLLSGRHGERGMQEIESRSANSSPTPLSPINLIVPCGGEKFQPGNIAPIVWSGNPPGSAVAIEVSRNGGIDWQTIADNVTADRFLWPVPENQQTGSEYLLRVFPSALKEKNQSPLRIIPADTLGITVDLSPDGRYVATAGRNTTLSLWNRQSGDPIATMSGHTGSIQSCRYNFDGSKIVSSALDGKAIIWDVAGRKAEHVLEGKEGTNVWCATFSPDGKIVATAHDSGSVILWDAHTGAQLSTLHIHREAVRYLEFTPDGTRLVTASTDRTASITDLKTGTRLHRFVHHTISRYVCYPDKEAMQNAIVNTIQLTPDGSVAITAGRDGVVKFWNVASGTLIRSRTYHNGKNVAMIALSPDGKRLVSLGSDGTMALIDLRTGGVMERRTLNNGEVIVPMIHAGFGNDPRTVAVSHTDGRVSIWDIGPLGAISGAFWSIGK